MKKLKFNYLQFSNNEISTGNFMAKFVTICTRWNKDYLLGFVDAHLIHYPSPINLTYAWSFGSLAGLCLVIQILTGLF